MAVPAVYAAFSLPGNGRMLAAVAMMAAGWNGAPERHAPGSWAVRAESLRRMP